MTLLDKAKLALRLVDDGYNIEIEGLIASAKKDLQIAGVQCHVEPDIGTVIDPALDRAIITYVKLHFGDIPKDEWDRLKASYDEQKAQLQTASGYTDWGQA